MKKQPIIQKNQHQRQKRRDKDKERNRLEREQMEEQTQRISIGVLTFFKPRPTDKISKFTLALPKSIPKSKLYPILQEVFDGCWNGEPTKSLYLHLSKPLPLRELRKRVREGIEKLI